MINRTISPNRLAAILFGPELLCFGGLFDSSLMNGLEERARARRRVGAQTVCLAPCNPWANSGEEPGVQT